MSKKTACPNSFITVGAYSILMRHEIEARDDHWRGSYAGMLAALKEAESDLRRLGFASMELAEGQRLMLDAARECEAGDFERAYHTQRMGHNSWRLMLMNHGIATPTDDEILAAIAAMKSATTDRGASVSKSMEKLAVLGNWR